MHMPNIRAAPSLACEVGEERLPPVKVLPGYSEGPQPPGYHNPETMLFTISPLSSGHKLLLYSLGALYEGSHITRMPYAIPLRSWDPGSQGDALACYVPGSLSVP